jgi:PilZ domain-containing protein
MGRRYVGNRILPMAFYDLTDDNLGCQARLGIAWIRRIPPLRLKCLRETGLREMATLVAAIMAAALGQEPPRHRPSDAAWRHNEIMHKIILQKKVFSLLLTLGITTAPESRLPVRPVYTKSFIYLWLKKRGGGFEKSAFGPAFALNLMVYRRLHLPHANARTDKRRWQRVAIPVPVFVRGIDELGKDFLEFSTALNISRGGALLATRRYLPPASIISLQIPPPPFPSQSLPRPVVGSLEAKVVQVRQASRYYLSGLSFTTPLAAE